MNLTTLEAAVAAMTPGPWTDMGGSIDAPRGEVAGYDDWGPALSPENSAGIVALRNAAPALLAVAKAAQELADVSVVEEDGAEYERAWKALKDALAGVE